MSEEEELQRRDKLSFNPAGAGEFLSYKYFLEKSLLTKPPKKVIKKEYRLDLQQYSLVKEFCSENSFHFRTVFACVLALITKFHSGQEKFILPISDHYKYDPFLGFGQLVYKPLLVDPSLSNVSKLLEYIEETINGSADLREAAIFDSFDILPVSFNYLENESQKESIKEAKLNFNVLEQDTSILIEISSYSEFFSNEDLSEFLSQSIIVLNNLIKNPESSTNAPKILLANSLSDDRDKTPTFRLDMKRFGAADVYAHFQEICKKYSNFFAIITSDVQLTYADFEKEIEKFSELLKQQKIQKNDVLAYCAAADSLYAICLLTSIKLGITFVPIDPTLPQERIESLINESGATYFISGDEKNISIKKIASALSSENAKENNVAYIIYTSGTTGSPKKIAITYSNLSHFLSGFLDVASLKHEDQCLFLAPISFSSSFRQIMGPLLSGACVHIVPAELKLQMINLLRYILEKKITVIQVTPSFFKLFIMMVRIHCIIHSQDPDLLENDLRLVISASEPLMYDTVKDWWFDLKQKSEIINMYGQTETSGVVTAFKIERNRPPERKIVPIGRAIKGVQISIKDSEMNDLPIGVAGEIVITGPIISPEYTQDHDTYCTGDIGYMLPSGEAQFIERSKNQVKVGGIRIDLSEINYHIRQHTSIRDVQIVAYEEKDGKEPILIAFIMPKCSYGETNIQLRDFLSKKLPTYMIPNHFLYIDRFPVTQTGKVNFSELLKQFQEYCLRLNSNHEKPQSSFEMALFEMWSSILKVKNFGVTDNFFDIGGHSLLVLRLIGKIKKTYKLGLKPKDIVDNATIRSLSQLISSIQKEKEEINV